MGGLEAGANGVKSRMRQKRCQGAKCKEVPTLRFIRCTIGLENEHLPKYCAQALCLPHSVPTLVDRTSGKGTAPARGEEVSLFLCTDLENIKIIVWGLLEGVPASGQ